MSMSGPDWHLTDSTIAALHFVEWLIINDGSTNNFVDVHETDMEKAWASAEDHGWVETVYPDRRRPRRLGDDVPEPRARITGAGHRHLDSVRRLRADNRARAAACRQALLLWLYNEGRGVAGTNAFLETGAYLFYGKPFTEQEVSDAVSYLMDRGYIDGIESWGPVVARPKLTSAGIECVEHADGDVRTFTAAQLGTFGQPSSVTYQQNFNAPVTGQVGQGETVQQTQNQGIDAEALGAIFKAMRDALSEVPDPDDRGDVEYAIQQLQAAAVEEDTEQVEEWSGRVRRLAGRLGHQALTAAVTTGTQDLLRLLGIG